MKSINKRYYFKAFGYSYMEYDTLKEAVIAYNTVGYTMDYVSIILILGTKSFTLFKDKWHNSALIKPFNNNVDKDIQFYIELVELV